MTEKVESEVLGRYGNEVGQGERPISCSVQKKYGDTDVQKKEKRSSRNNRKIEYFKDDEKAPSGKLGQKVVLFVFISDSYPTVTRFTIYLLPLGLSVSNLK